MSDTGEGIEPEFSPLASDRFRQTAYAREQDRRRAIRAGFQMHLAKPIEPAELT